MATLTVGDVTPRAQYTATNAQTAFTYSFPIFADGDLKVYIGSTLKTLTTDYTVSGAGTSAGGTVTLVTGATTGDIVTIVRDIPIARSSDYQTGGALLSETLNDDFDKLVMMAQQNESGINTRSIRFSNTSGDLPLPELVGDATARANMTLIFDADGNPALDDTNINVSTITDNIDTINTVAGDLNGSRDSFDYGSIASTDPVSNPASPTGALQGVYDIRSDITTVSGISANVITVATNDTNITTIADNMTAINNAQTAANNAAADAASAETARAAAVVAKVASETAETNAETAETNAETSETNAATSATNAATSASTATTQATSATASATSATASATSATSSASSATTSAATATTKATAASTSATNAATSETNAGTSASGAATSASGAATSATNAATSATNAETAYDNFDDRYLGQKSSDPSVDNDSNALLTGAIYFNTTSSAMKVYTGSAWTAVAPVATSVTASQISDVTATAAELNYTDGVTSLIQTQLDAKQASDADLTTLATNGIGTSANQLVQLNGSAQLPAVSGANLTNLPAGGATDIDGLSDGVYDGSSVGLGNATLANDDGGNLNVAVGKDALTSNTSGNTHVAVGEGSLYTNTTGSNNTAIGRTSMYFNTTGANSVAVGGRSLYANTTGSNNAALGISALSKNTTGGENTAVGKSALFNSTAGNKNVAIGTSALDANTTGSDNVAVGYWSLKSKTTGDYNVAVGSQALKANTAEYNTALGYVSLYTNTTGSSNVGVGTSTLYDNTTGSSNTAVGRNALNYNSTGSNNTAIGKDSLKATTAPNNTAVGKSSLALNTTGEQSTAVGCLALYYNTSGKWNTAVGNGSLSSMTTGNNNTGLGYNATAPSGTGYDSFTLGNGSISNLRCNDTSISSLSDQRDKTNIQDIPDSAGLELINKLRPVTYHWDRREWYDDGVSDGSKIKADWRRWKSNSGLKQGFIAQEVQAAISGEKCLEDSMIVTDDNPDKLEFAPQHLLTNAIKAIQQLSAENKALIARIEALENA